jgi:hypothetical protein
VSCYACKLGRCRAGYLDIPWQLRPHSPNGVVKVGSRGLHLRQGARPLHLSGGGASEDDGYGQRRPWDPLHRTRAGVSGVPTQAQMLPEYARSQDRARCQRGRARRSSSARKEEAFEQSCRERKRIEMLFAHLKANPATWPSEVTGTARSPLRIYTGRHRPEPAPACQARRQIAARGCRVRCVSVVAGVGIRASQPPLRPERAARTGRTDIRRGAPAIFSPSFTTKSAHSFHTELEGWRVLS